MELLERDVRFGDVGPGRLLHHTRVMHLLIVGCEAFANRLGVPFADVVSDGGVPYMPVAVRAAFDRYPRYGDTVSLHGTPVDVGDTSLTAGYVLRRADGDRLATATVVHVTVDADGTPQPVPDVVRERVDDGVGDVPGVDHGLAPEDADVGDDPFGHEFTVRSPQLEAVGWGYFEEYFRAIATALEEHLDEYGRSLGDRSDPVYPFVPTGLAFEFRRPIRFEDVVSVEGRLAVDGADVVGHYRFGDERGPRLLGVVTYGCFDENGEPTAFPETALAGVR